MNKIKVALIGVGAISGIYIENITKHFTDLELIGICDHHPEKARQVCEKYQLRKVYEDMEEAFTDPEVDIILNLTRPSEHYRINKAALLAGKHVYSEKPLAECYEEGLELADLAKARKLMLGGAPDTFLGAGIQTCRKLIKDGLIGTPIGCAAFMICRGHESWHPNPEFYYQQGGGPMMDMGPYYLTAMINLLGGVSGVTGIAKASFPTRTITSEPKRGTEIKVEVPTYVTGILNFDRGAVGTIFTTFDVYYKQQARLEIYGSEGTLLVPDPNYFGGPVRLLRPEDAEYREIPLLYHYSENFRGLGLADMVAALQTGRECRAGYEQTLHVLEIMTAFEKSSREGRYIPLKTHFEQKPILS